MLGLTVVLYCGNTIVMLLLELIFSVEVTIILSAEVSLRGNGNLIRRRLLMLSVRHSVTLHGRMGLPPSSTLPWLKPSDYLQPISLEAFSLPSQDNTDDDDRGITQHDGVLSSPKPNDGPHRRPNR